jgi:uncharacterized Ntn-hydrolase superfamily protein
VEPPGKPVARLVLVLAAGVLLAAALTLKPATERAAPPSGEARACTFSLVAFDAEAKEWGVIVASKYLAVGAAVPWARAGAGAVATQSLVNTTYGTRGLELLAQGQSASEVLRTLTSEDRGRETRQLGIVDARGGVAAFTGKRSYAWAGHKTGKNYTCQGNLLSGPKVVADMARAFEEASGPLAWRLMTALEAGEKAGGDKRGKQAAALLVVRDGGGPNGWGDRAIDLRVDDHEEPVRELARILAKCLPRPER